MGRPSSYTLEIGERICSRIAMDEALEDICAEEAMPDRVTVWRWQQADEGFRNAYARAREEQAHTIVDKQATLRRKVESGELEPAVALASHKIGSWEAGKRLPKQYGERMQLANDPDAPLTKQLTADEVADQLVAALAKAEAARKG